MWACCTGALPLVGMPGLPLCFSVLESLCVLLQFEVYFLHFLFFALVKSRV